MAKIYLASATGKSSEWCDYPQVRIEASFRKDRYGKHSLSRDPQHADIILFATNHDFNPLGMGLLSEPLFRRYHEKCVLFDSSDNPSPIIGGLCASRPSSPGESYAPALGWCYHHPTSAEPYITSSKPSTTPRYLWSFKGSCRTNKIRQEIFSLSDERSRLEDTSSETLANLMGQTDAKTRQAFIEQYIQLLYDSAFILCPRGIGPSSMRIFETMRAGRAPVIISDDWCPPPFVNWADCSLRLAEDRIDELPDFLRRKEDEAERLGNNAKKEWEKVFGETGLFHHTVEACLSLLDRRENESRMQKVLRLKYLGLPPYNRAIMRYCKNQVKNRITQWRSR